MWWDDATIKDTINRDFILSKLDAEDHEHVDQNLRFGGSLTDDTYGEWIIAKLPKLFLILVDCGVQDQIFGVIDDSWDDEDLPVQLDEVERLRLTEVRDERLELQFYQRQFAYLLRSLGKDDHIDYDHDELVPLDVERKLVALAQAHCALDKVIVPGIMSTSLSRQAVSLGSGAGNLTYEDYIASLENMRGIEHKHVVSLWASYTHQDVGYVLLTPTCEGTLRSLITNFPLSIRLLEKEERRTSFLRWLYCLADALAYIHSRGIYHGSIRPTNIGLTNTNELFISTSGPLPGHDTPKGFDKEAYDFAAPEHGIRPSSSSSRVGSDRRSTAPSIASLRNGSISSTFTDVSSIYTSSTSSNQSVTSSSVLDVAKASDVYSLGCIYLEILTQLCKRTSKAFASHRAAKNKTPGRGGGLPDSSYHKNLGQVESWIQQLTKEASKKDDKTLSKIPDILSIVQQMISPDPYTRPTAMELRTKLHAILGPDIQLCCSPPSWSSFDVQSPTSPAESVSPTCFPAFERRNSDQSTVSTVNTLETIRASDWTNGIPTRRLSTITTNTFSTVRTGSGISVMARSINGDGREIKERRYASGGGRTAKPRARSSKKGSDGGDVYSGQSSETCLTRTFLIRDHLLFLHSRDHQY